MAALEVYRGPSEWSASSVMPPTTDRHHGRVPRFTGDRCRHAPAPGRASALPRAARPRVRRRGPERPLPARWRRSASRALLPAAHARLRHSVGVGRATAPPAAHISQNPRPLLVAGLAARRGRAPSVLRHASSLPAPRPPRSIRLGSRASAAGDEARQGKDQGLQGGSDGPLRDGPGPSTTDHCAGREGRLNRRSAPPDGPARGTTLMAAGSRRDPIHCISQRSGPGWGGRGRGLGLRVAPWDPRSS
jgi:hypothetical protein